MRIVQWVAFGFFFLIGLNKADAAVTIEVDLSTQQMHVTSASGEQHVWPISSARAGYTTPTGNFQSQHLERMHHSKKYDNAPMPYSIFFRGGYAIHATDAVRKLGRPASHGCIRLSPANAERLFGMVRGEGAVISISRSSNGTGSARRPAVSGSVPVTAAPYPPLWSILANR
jgi:lipoprotein-anchoring transpeptidase ErfK/SrfK